LVPPSFFFQFKSSHLTWLVGLRVIKIEGRELMRFGVWSVEELNEFGLVVRNEYRIHYEKDDISIMPFSLSLSALSQE